MHARRSHGGAHRPRQFQQVLCNVLTKRGAGDARQRLAVHPRFAARRNARRDRHPRHGPRYRRTRPAAPLRAVFHHPSRPATAPASGSPSATNRASHGGSMRAAMTRVAARAFTSACRRCPHERSRPRDCAPRTDSSSKMIRRQRDTSCCCLRAATASSSPAAPGTASPARLPAEFGSSSPTCAARLRRHGVIRTLHVAQPAACRSS